MGRLSGHLSERLSQQTRVYPYPVGVGSARPDPKMGAPDPENPLFLGFSVLRGGLRPWSQTMVSEGARPWGRGRSGDCDLEGLLWHPLRFTPSPHGTAMSSLQDLARHPSKLLFYSISFASSQNRAHTKGVMQPHAS